jgi:hypothetical protein
VISRTMEHIPLKAAYLCQDCECVGNCATQCPACASTSLLNLSAVLNREGGPAAIHQSMDSMYRSALAA